MALMVAGCGTDREPGAASGPHAGSTAEQRPVLAPPALPDRGRGASTTISPGTGTLPDEADRRSGTGSQPGVGTGPVPVASLPGWSQEDAAGLDQAIARQCALRAPPVPWPRLCAEVPRQAGRLKEWVQQRFVARPVTGADGNADGLITGYHEPALTGSLVRRDVRQEPVYRRPPAEVLTRRPTRAEIERSAMLAGSELAWIDDPVEAFFLHVQGSGRIRLPDGKVLRIGYAGDNGQPYTAIGRVLRERGASSEQELDAGRIKAWLRANPGQARDVMRSNARYIFFRELPPADPDEGPPGSLNVPLTAGRSIAVDPRHVPRGALMFLSTTHPADGSPLRRLVMAQDTGAAITGAVRADLFWGSGQQAETNAGLMKQRGRLWLLVPVGAN